MNYKKMLMVGLAAVAVFSLSGCGTVVKKYTNTELRGEVVSASKLKDSPKVLSFVDKTEAGRTPWNSKMESAQGVIVSTDMKSFSKGFRMNITYMKVTSVSEIPVQEGDVVDVWVPPISEASEKAGEATLVSAPIVRRVVCKKSDADYKECFKDPARGGEYGIIDKETGKATNW